MAGMPTNQRDQLMLFVGIIGILGAGSYWNWVYGPEGERIDALRTHVEKLDEQNNRAKALTQRGNTQQLQDEAKRLQANLDLMRTLIPTSNEVPTLLDQMLGAARRTGMEIAGITPGATVEGETFDTIKFRLSMQGDYHDIGEVLAAMGSLRRIIVPVNVALAPAAGSGARANSPGEAMLTANFEIQTYVAKAPAAGEDQ